MPRPRLEPIFAALAALSLVAAPAAAEEDGDARAIYLQHCASCHGSDRLGGTGPALLPESLTRLTMGEALRTITAGRPATQMPAFEATLSPEAVAAVAALIYKPLPEPPGWTLEQMRTSRTVITPPDTLPAKPVHGADPLNLFTVVETGDSQVTILDGDRFEPIWRFPSRFALHGGAKYSPDGRFVYLGSRDGWVSKHDLYGLKSVAEIRAGINLRNIAVSADGRYVIVGNTLPNTVVILDARDLTPLKVIPVEDRAGRASRVSAVYAAPPRQSFIVALRDQPELWEIFYEDDPEPQANGFVHSYQPGMLEGAFDHGPFPVRRIPLDEALDDFFFGPAYRVAVGAGRTSRAGQVSNLNVGRKIADVSIGGMPHLASGISFEHRGGPVLATPVLNEPAVGEERRRAARPAGAAGGRQRRPSSACLSSVCLLRARHHSAHRHADRERRAPASNPARGHHHPGDAGARRRRAADDRGADLRREHPCPPGGVDGNRRLHAGQRLGAAAEHDQRRHRQRHQRRHRSHRGRRRDRRRARLSRHRRRSTTIRSGAGGPVRGIGTAAAGKSSEQRREGAGAGSGTGTRTASPSRCPAQAPCPKPHAQYLLDRFPHSRSHARREPA